MPTPKTLLINGAELPLVTWLPGEYDGAVTAAVYFNGRLMVLDLPIDFGPGHAVNINSLFIQWGE